jgi:hypothetical protein
MNLSVGIEGLEELSKAFDSKTIEKATVRTVNELGRGLSTKLVKDARSEYNIKSSELKSYIKTDRADKSDTTFSMTITSAPLSLSKFQMREKTFRTKRGKRKGVTVKVLRKKSRKVVRNGFSTGKQIFKREGKGRLPITKLTTLSAPQMFKENSIAHGYEEVEAKLPKVYERNLNFYGQK